MNTKKQSRLRRARRSRPRIQSRGSDSVRSRLCVLRSPRHIYAQVIDDDSGRVLISASSLEKAHRGELSSGGNVEAAKAVGKRLAEKAQAAGISRVRFDRSGYKYHGRIRALADAAREGGLDF